MRPLQVNKYPWLELHKIAHGYPQVYVGRVFAKQAAAQSLIIFILLTIAVEEAHFGFEDVVHSDARIHTGSVLRECRVVEANIVIAKSKIIFGQWLSTGVGIAIGAVELVIEAQLAVVDVALGDTRLLRPAVMLNLLGDDGFSGPAKYRGIEEALALPGVSVHLYGKTHTQPFRKMGHITVTADTLEEAMRIADRIEAGVYA